MADRLRSTALTFGRFRTRDHVRLAAAPELTRRVAAGRLTLQAGAVYDDTNRDSAAVSPVLAAALERDTAAGPVRFHAEYAENSQVATYTALNSNPTAGLFRGNPDLKRQFVRNLELGASLERGGWQVELAAFHRREDGLVDWTFRQGVVARTANPVDIGVTGLELLATRQLANGDIVLGYTFLDKDGDYGSALVDASFYALNFARHRLTAALTFRLGHGWEVRLDNEVRLQEPNPLRLNGGDEAVMTTIGVHYRPPRLPALELSLQVDNLWDDDFEEVPAVPAGRRQLSAGVIWRW
jgi:vitamin B12 transporter